jgi:phenylalanyl-tRNA synthetase beta chain
VKIVVSWLRELCPVELTPVELADLLSIRGVHVEGILTPWEGLSGVVVARVLDVRDHPNSDKLCLARVSYGLGERELVVGVRNIRPGDLVPLAGPGAMVPGLEQPLGRREIRGVVSEGMLCSPKELGISGDHGGILILPPESEVGADFKQAFGLDDAVLDIEIEPNRPDLMSVLGVAREVSAATGLPLSRPDMTLDEAEEKTGEVASVEVRDLQRCPRYVARVVRGVTVGPSPIRIQARLTASGMRPLSNVVDATNYAMLEIGQPLHPFDLARLAGGAIVVRRAEEGERLVTLDDVERTLSSDDLVIADRQRPVAIAGVMGSAPGEVHPQTVDVLVESAYFEPKGVIRTSRRLNLQTEASTRFGRGADPENPPNGADLACRLISQWAGGHVLSGAVEVGEAPERRRLRVRPARASLVLGYQVAAQDVHEVFRRLSIASADAGEEGVEVEIPGYRVDLRREIDLIEEIVRVQGYHSLGTTLPGIKQAGSFAPSFVLRRRARAALVGAGLREALSLSFSSAEDLELMGHATGVRVANPVSAEEPFLRTSLLPGLLKALRRNSERGVRTVALFETGHVFLAGDPLEERESVAGAMTGPARAAPGSPGALFDVFDAKGAVEALMEGLGVRSWELGSRPSMPWHPGRSASVEVQGVTVGVLGELHPRVASRFDLSDRVALFELDLSRLEPFAGYTLEFREVPRFPPVHRDLAFQLDEAVPAGDVRDAIVEGGSGLVEPGAVVLFDVFTGDPIPEGYKSLAFSVEFRASDRTLTDDEADRAVRSIVAKVAERFGAELRGG